MKRLKKERQKIKNISLTLFSVFFTIIPQTPIPVLIVHFTFRKFLLDLI